MARIPTSSQLLVRIAWPIAAHHCLPTLRHERRVNRGVELPAVIVSEVADLLGLLSVDFASYLYNSVI